MDFKSLLTKIHSLNDQVDLPKAPELPKAVQLNEDAQLRVLAGTSSYIAEAKKKADEKMDEVFDADAKVGDKKKTASGGTAEKTKTGLKHTAGDRYSGKQAEKEDKKKKDESVNPDFKSKFDKMVEAAKAKPDFLDMDKDGDKKEPMKKALADKKKKGPVEEGKDEGKPGKNFAKIAKKAAKKYGSKEAGERVAGAVRKKVLAKESKMVAESVEQKLTFKQMVKLVQESGGQQQIDPKDQELFAWATRVAKSKLGEGMKADLYAGLVYERMGGVFEMYDVLSEAQK
jgi:hypothetical protein